MASSPRRLGSLSRIVPQEFFSRLGQVAADDSVAGRRAVRRVPGGFERHGHCAVLICDGTGWSVLGPVGADGRYRVKGVPVGGVSAIILPPPRDPTVKYPDAVPARYESHESSGLKLEIHRGSNVFDIPMVSRE